MPVALTRTISPLLEQCELTHVDRQKIDLNIANAQHREYELALQKMGYSIRRLPEAQHLPDGVFVEDTAVVFQEIAIITRPGAPSRQEESQIMAQILKEYRELRFIEAPGTIDGGDVLVFGRNVYIGMSSRSNREGVLQFAKLLAPFGYHVKGVPVDGCLHLKTAIAVLEADLLFINPAWVDPKDFEGTRFLHVHPEEPYSANVMRRENYALCPEKFTRTRNLLAKQGYDVLTVDQSELAKAEAGLTCCSVIIEDLE